MVRQDLLTHQNDLKTVKMVRSGLLTHQNGEVHSDSAMKMGFLVADWAQRGGSAMKTGSGVAE